METVTAETPAHVEVLESKQLDRIPGVNLDDRLRMIPGFSLFRRSSSLVAHPTTQGVSLRGLGSTGASRSIVLWDGIPVNDPFGGWVYWTRVSPEELARVEISRGATTSAFGDRAMGGALALFSREPESRRLTAAYEFGNRNTHLATMGFSHLWQRFALSGRGRAFTTNGYYIIPEATRGAVDREANVRFVASDARLDYFDGRQRVFLKADLLVEDRGNGTPIQLNSTGLGTLAGNYLREWGNDSISLLGYHTRGEFRSGFSTILAARAREQVSFLQTVPSEAVGGSGFWRHSGDRFQTLVGADALRVEGQSIDSFPTIRRVGGGSLAQQGTFAQGDWKLGSARLFGGVRHQFTGQQRQFFSPSAGVTAGKNFWRVRASAYRSFRAPTLNELYREFRQGNAVTQANNQLKPESVVGVEAGVDLTGESTRLGFTAFHNELKHLITNVTLRSTPAEIVRQRQNAAEARARGFEADLRQRWRQWHGEVSYLFVESHFSNQRWTPQIPRHQGSGQVTWSGSKGLVSFGVRSYAAQFEDDLNRFLLPGFATAHVAARWQVWRNLSAQGMFENLFDREYVVGFSPTPLVGAPRLWRVGLRWDGRLW